MAGFIDIHHHFFCPDLNASKSSASARAGWQTPKENMPWTPELSIKTMDSAGIQAAILSFPAFPSGEISSENRAQARRRNDHVADICQKYPARFGFFATLPFLDDVQGGNATDYPEDPDVFFVIFTGVLGEIAYVFDVIGADGISMSSSYGEGVASTYIGDKKYEAIWAELDKREAVVFLHGNQVPSSIPWPHPTLGLPVCEVPSETFKAAAHLVVTGCKRRFPKVKIILAHLGGSTPFLASRVAVLARYMGCQLTSEEMLCDFRTFYYDTALSAWGPSLSAMNDFVPHTRIIFGTDFPAVSTQTSLWFTRQLIDHYSDDETKLHDIMRNNALGMFPALCARILAKGGTGVAKTHKIPHML